ncbi:MAG: tRNA (adenosine(37)-N6)-threonylcarbamoyltransferase complex dimerization subunit type 1 TsaB [Candidatus Marinimicrobia bacterium]|nr:tRNA (adenosine(37)-N6)-threonylcarbamoyltransferase complex dimerization subunit type 1 TsaB [Candidatus Neomarinimicrobiota bacterium]MDP6593764.1 tRNA (adenosine(37)-N6)-threonylcarbamoyltransferase complex dimerization subunit type 1 TsaB [Candidatus Neomarinimicrobiota bacterium]MDP6837245.1 tRNA (adenosine(37)-N6)-threonylcarbamoyltransferase complex dimerization subunit type 1 TsaB [Candidatus Neomarinimicrobiota bacterium]MDP6967149.1 tRNA (adenosine(37)-N6)-threonylcarbamoyltransfera
MNLLAIETATSVCGVALFWEDKLLDLEEAELEKEHAEKLPQFYREVMLRNSFHLKDLDAIAVSIGPGSFTGLRIGLSFAKGLAFAVDLPLVPVPTLITLASGVETGDARVRSVLRSHRDYIYYQDFSMEENTATEMGIPLSSLWDEMLQEAPNGTLICHYGCSELIASRPGECYYKAITPSAARVGELAIRSIDAWQQKDFRTLEPNYISHFRVGSRKKAV